MPENPYTSNALRAEILTRQLEVNAKSRAAHAVKGTPAYAQKMAEYKAANQSLQDYIASLRNK